MVTKGQHMRDDHEAGKPRSQVSHFINEHPQGLGSNRPRNLEHHHSYYVLSGNLT